MKLDDVVAVIGLKNRATELVEALCRSIGMEVFYAMKKLDPSQRIDSVAEDAAISAPLEAVPENVFRLGLMAANPLCAAGTLDCNLTDERDMFGHVLGWFAHRITSPDELPAGWMLLDPQTSPTQAGFDPSVETYAIGQILTGGKLVVGTGQGKRLVQVPAEYRDAVASLERPRF